LEKHELQSFLHNLTNDNVRPDIICLQEIWQIRNSDVLKIPGYQNLIYQTRDKNSQGGGGWILSQRRY
jgi:exonuclease III